VLHSGLILPYPQSLDKQPSSLLRRFVNYKENNFITLGPEHGKELEGEMLSG
jgi:hypothetical protein